VIADTIGDKELRSKVAVGIMSLIDQGYEYPDSEVVDGEFVED
jgi:hypothetical protein